MLVNRSLGVLSLVACIALTATANEVPVVPVEGQPLAANAKRLVEALRYLGAPLDAQLESAIEVAGRARDAAALQRHLDAVVLFVVSINPELRVKVHRGPGNAELQQGGYTPVLVKVLNESTISNALKIVSPQSGPVYSGPSLNILKRQAQTELKQNENLRRATDRFLELEMYRSPPMTPNLSGLEVEYAIALIYCSESGKREATIGFDIGSGNQDLGFRGEVPVLFSVRPAVPVSLSVLDHDGTPTAARLTIRDKSGHTYPPQAKRLAPDFFFQPQIYRHDGGTVLLPHGEYEIEYSRGPEYRVSTKTVRIRAERQEKVSLRLQRWIEPSQFGFYSGDHHIHAAGCSHYDSPTQGVRPEDMFTQIKGEGLNVGCVLTWGPCYDFQRQYFSPVAATISEPLVLMKYDLEISGFGSAALGHVCLLNLKDQTYPGSAGRKDKGWPTWTVPVLRWTKEQGGYTGYPHSAFDVDPAIAADRLIELRDRDGDGELSAQEAAFELLPESVAQVDEDGNGRLTRQELFASTGRAANELPNLALPNMNGGGALEICVAAAEGVCDFISAMDTPRVSEWNIWYHIMNCGIPLKVSGETDFPCMSGRRVGQGRVYVQLGQVDQIDFATWTKGLAEGRSYVSDGYAHALDFSVNGVQPGTQDVRLTGAGQVSVSAKVAFSAEVPEGVAYGNLMPKAGRQLVGDTVHLHAPRSQRIIQGGDRLVELVVNGEVVGSQEIPADGRIHDLTFDIPMTRSSWIALRHFPQLHTNPVHVLVDDQPIRGSRASALWCAETIRLLWKYRRRFIDESERKAAEAAYQRAITHYERVAAECPP